MPNIHDTAYPRLKSSVTENELDKYYTPSHEEIAQALRFVKGQTARLGFLILLKTFQRLGYFVKIADVPERMVGHVAQFLGFRKTPALHEYDDSGSRRRHVALVREYLQVKPFDHDGKRALLDATKEASLTKEDLADIINVGIEELLRTRFELPAFSTILRTAQYARSQVNTQIYEQVAVELGEEGRRLVDALIKVSSDKSKSDWELLKNDPGRPTLNNLRNLLPQIEWLKEQNFDLISLRTLADAKLRNFAAQAKSLDAARMEEMAPNKRYTLAAALLRMQLSRRLDDLGDIMVKRIQSIHSDGREALKEYRARHQAETDALIDKLHSILITIRDTEPLNLPERMTAVQSAAGQDATETIVRCEEHSAFKNDNYAPFLWQFYKGQRSVLFRLLNNLDLVSTSTDKSTESIVKFILKHRTSKLELIDASELDLSWVSEKWWRVLRPKSADTDGFIFRRHFEVCAFSQIVHELKSGDLCIRGSDNYSDYSKQLITWDEFNQSLPLYCKQAGLPNGATELIADLKKELSDTASRVDRGFPRNEALRIENGEPVLSKIEKKKPPPQLSKLLKFIEERVDDISILDVFADTDHCLDWTKVFGPLSGLDAKVANPKSRYLITVFGYGCGLGPSQTARSVKLLDRRQIAWINQRHITEELLDKQITEVINAYNQFKLPKVWGSGKSASADGTKWNLYEQNLLSEYHIRYGGYGGLGYYHLSDMYIALFSHFIPCGVWEAVYILDGLLKNESDIQPDTLHADTQGQSTPVFGLAHLLGIKLMPRIRNWKDLKFLRPTKDINYKHIDELFTEVVNWELIETHFQDLLRIVISIKQGRVSASAILRRLGTYSRKNKLYDAFCELGRVIRTIFLLNYISDPALRTTINAATNKSESFNDFIKWIRFGGEGTLKENDRDEQRKLIKYNHLVANLVIFHNVCTLTRLLNQLAQEGHEFDEETIAAISPFIREHINRFGDYILNLEREFPLPSREFMVRKKKFAKAG